MEAQARGDSESIETLRVQLQEAQVALTRQQLAASIDFAAIKEANGRAVAKVFVDFGEEVYSATAFSVDRDGTLVTNRHVVHRPLVSREPVRIAVQFADSRQVWKARVLSVSQEEDLAALKVEGVLGGVPFVEGLNDRVDTLTSGSPVALIGFPLGGADTTGEEATRIARTTTTAGVLIRIQGGRIEVRGYGVEGSSGSPLFDGAGRVVGVLFGGTETKGERTLYAVSADRVKAFLATLR